MLMAEEKDKMRSMVGNLEEYLNKKRFEQNAEKIKIMRFRKKERRVEKKS